jgi:uncharacterized protein DUF5691
VIGTVTWTEVLASALVGTARSGERAEVVLDAAAGQALRRRAGLPLVPAPEPGDPSPAEDSPVVGPAAAARVDDLLAVDSVTRSAGPVRDVAGRLQLLAEWLDAASAAGRRLPPELAPALLDMGRRHPELRPLIGPVAGRLAGWLATQRADWSYAAAGQPGGSTDESTVDGDGDPVRTWELGSTAQRVGYLRRLRRRDPDGARALLEAAWDAEPPEERAALLGALHTGLSTSDESIVELALDDRHRQVRDAALELVAALPDSGYARRMAERARACVDLSGTGRIGISPPAECDRSMRRDGIAPRPPAGTGARAWWLEEILARTPLGAWPEPAVFLGRGMSEEWVDTVRRGLARAAASQRDGGWAAALVDSVTADLAVRGHPADRQLLAALLAALPADDLAARATAGLREGLGSAAAVGVEQMLALCPRPWPPALADAVLAALDERLAPAEHDGPGSGAAGAANGGAAGTGPGDGQGGAPHGGAPGGAGSAGLRGSAGTSGGHGGRPGVDFSGTWRVAGICELAALRLPVEIVPRATELARRWWILRNEAAGQAGGGRTIDPVIVIVERFAATLRYRREMHEELG